MELFEYLYIRALIFFSIPIVLSFILRKIAGKHAPEHEDVDWSFLAFWVDDDDDYDDPSNPLNKGFDRYSQW